MKKLYIFSAVLLQSAVLWAQEPVKHSGQVPVQVSAQAVLPQPEALHLEYILQMQAQMEQQTGNLPQERVPFPNLPKGAVRVNPHQILPK